MLLACVLTVPHVVLKEGDISQPVVSQNALLQDCKFTQQTYNHVTNGVAVIVEDRDAGSSVLHKLLRLPRHIIEDYQPYTLVHDDTPISLENERDAARKDSKQEVRE